MYVRNTALFQANFSSFGNVTLVTFVNEADLESVMQVNKANTILHALKTHSMQSKVASGRTPSRESHDPRSQVQLSNTKHFSANNKEAQVLFYYKR